MDPSLLIPCTDGVATFLVYFDPTLAPNLLNYSYLSMIVVALFAGTFVLVHNSYSLSSRVLFALTFFFSIFIFNEYLQWVVIPAGFMDFTYSLSLLYQFLIVASTVYFVSLFVRGRDLSFAQKLGLAVLGLPIILLLSSKLNLQGVELDSCTGVIGPLWWYFYSLEILAVIGFLVWAGVIYRRYRALRTSQLLSSLFLLIGSALFLAIFFVSYAFADYTGVYEINLMGPLGMAVFIVVLSYMIVRFHTFNIRLLAAQALVSGLVILIGAMLLVTHSALTRTIGSITLVLSIIGGYFLVRSVKKEVQQREEIARLAESLRSANERLKVLDKLKSEFVSIASHQLRSPLTSIRGYASMLVEGTYGKLSDKAQEAANNIADAAKYMALSVEDYLNVSRIEAGNMKYEMSDFNLAEVAGKIVDEMRPVAMKKGLVMVYRSDVTGSGFVHGDIGKTRQVILNLLDNSMKYTPKGTITVVAHDDVKAKKMCVTVSDTGVGMSAETLGEVFDKFVRAKNANSVNTTGTGLGLYVAKKMITDMGGKVWAESEGEGEGLHVPCRTTAPSRKIDALERPFTFVKKVALFA